MSVFGNTLFGAVNGTLALKPSGGSDAWGWVAGVRYANGPYTIGALYSQYDSQGDIRLTGISQRHSNVIYAAATYSVAPGLTVFADYAYGTRHQGGYNFITGAVPTPTTATTTSGRRASCSAPTSLGNRST